MVPDEKLPDAKTAVLRCPKCKEKLIIDLAALRKGKEAQKQHEKGSYDFGFDEGSEDYDVSERPFDFLEEEGKTAIICEDDPKIVKEIVTVLGIMEYTTTVVDSLRDALRKMKYHIFDMVLVNETFGGSDPDSNGILIYLERLNMDIRRNIFVGLLTRQYPTMDNMAAFLKSVNMTINIKDIDKIDKILSRGINEYELFYAIFKDSAKKIGMA
jgi:CheY-like chemotaxis protein